MVTMAFRIFLLRRFQHKMSLGTPAAEYGIFWSVRVPRQLLWGKKLCKKNSILVCDLELSLSSNQNRYKIKMLREANTNIIIYDTNLIRQVANTSYEISTNTVFFNMVRQKTKPAPSC